MDRESFKREYLKVDNNLRKEYDKNRILKIIKDSIDANSVDNNERGHRNLIIVMEELAELAQQISKELRGKCISLDLLQELADVQLGIYYIQEICEIEDWQLDAAMIVKSKRVENGLKENPVQKLICTGIFYFLLMSIY